MRFMLVLLLALLPKFCISNSRYEGIIMLLTGTGSVDWKRISIGLNKDCQLPQFFWFFQRLRLRQVFLYSGAPLATGFKNIRGSICDRFILYFSRAPLATGFVNFSDAPLPENKYFCIFCDKCKSHSDLLCYMCVFGYFLSLLIGRHRSLCFPLAGRMSKFYAGIFD